MMLIWISISVLSTLFVWRLCAVASIADEQMEDMYEKTRQEQDGVYLAQRDGDSIKEDVHAR